MPRKIFKFIAWLIGGALGLVVLFYLVVLAINWHDASPSQDATRFAQVYAKRPVVPDEQNAFVFMVGMAVEPAHDPVQAGKAMLGKARESSAKSGETEYSHPDYPRFEFDAVRNKDAQEFIDACKSVSDECLPLLKSKSWPGIQQESSDDVLLKRYRNLIKFTFWQDIYPGGLSGPIPPFSPVMSGHLLSLLDIWQQAKLRGAKVTIAMLEEDASFWRKVLVSSDSLITSMVAVSALKKNMLWTNLVLRRLSENNASLDVPASWLQPLSGKERLMERAWVGEWALSEPTMRNWAEQLQKDQASNYHGSFGTRLVTWLIMPLYQPQDSINRHATDLAAQVKLYNVSYEQLPDVMAKRDSALSKEYEEVIASPRVLYNPVGKLLFYTTKPDFGRYMQRVPDLEGGRRALLATLQLRAQKTSRENIAEVLAASPYRNPYTNQPFVWDAASGNVVFEGVDEGKRKRYSFAY